MKRFIFNALPSRVLFGSGTLARVADEAERLNASRILVISSTGRRAAAEKITGTLGNRAAGSFQGVKAHVPSDAVDEALSVAAELGADGCIAVGGGSSIGLGKAMALLRGLPLIAIPTTFAGSEMTPIYGITADGAKRTGRDPRVAPKTVIYDPELVQDLPPKTAGPSGMNAIAHCVEALYADNANPMTSLMAEEAIRVLATNLPRIYESPHDTEPRSEALYGAWLAGSCLGMVGMALHHKLCHVLGGAFGLPHAETHAVVLPHAVRYNMMAAPEAMARLRRAMQTDDPAGSLHDLARSVASPVALSEIGMPFDELDRAAWLATQDPYFNPRPVERDSVRCLLEAAWHGERPGAMAEGSSGA